MNTRRATSNRRNWLILSFSIMVLAAAVWFVPGCLYSTELTGSPLPQYLAQGAVDADNTAASESPQAIQLGAALESAVYMPLGNEIAFRTNNIAPDTGSAFASGQITSPLSAITPQCSISRHSGGNAAVAMNCSGIDLQ